MSAQKRIYKEYEQFIKEPLNGVLIKTYESNIFECDCFFEVKLKENSTWIPMKVIFPPNYPLKPPDVGFPINFGYNKGASYIKSDGPLKDMLVICLDILGNFAHVHNEWSDVKGSGWSPSYTLTSLLVNMQTVIYEELEHLNFDKFNLISSEWEKYKKINSLDLTVEKEKNSLNLKGLSPELILAIELINGELDDDISKASLNQLIQALNNKICSQKDLVLKIDPEIFCWFTNANYTEDIIGYGIQLKLQGKMMFLSTDGNYIGHKAYMDLNLRQYPNKDTFEYFLPAWINPTHSVKSGAWFGILKKSLMSIGKILNINKFEDIIIRVFCDLINTMVVKIMDVKSDIRASSVVFQCLLNLWRVFYFLTQNTAGLKNTIKSSVQQFINNKIMRTKKFTPNVGNMLAMSLVLNVQDILWPNFLQAFEEECNLRRVLWWQKDNIQLNGPGTFNQSKISRSNVLFQILLRTKLHEKGLDVTINQLDSLNCSIESGVESLLEAWRQIDNRMNITPSWSQYYTELVTMGFPIVEKNKITSNIDSYIQQCVVNAGKLDGYTNKSRRY